MKKSVINLLSVISLVLFACVAVSAQEVITKKNNYKLTLEEFKSHFGNVKLNGYTFKNAANNGRGGYNAIFINDKNKGATVTFDLVPNESFLTYKEVKTNKTPWKRDLYTRKGYKMYYLDTRGNHCIVVEAPNLGGTFAVVSYGELLDKKTLEKILDKSGFHTIKK